MPQKRRLETEDERMDRLATLAHELRDAGVKEEDDLEAMVQKSIKLQGP
jgi:hypothetical protein